MACLKGNSTGLSLFGLREVIPDQTGVEQWKELVLNTGNLIKHSKKNKQVLLFLTFFTFKEEHIQHCKTQNYQRAALLAVSVTQIKILSLPETDS